MKVRVFERVTIQSKVHLNNPIEEITDSMEIRILQNSPWRGKKYEIIEDESAIVEEPTLPELPKVQASVGAKSTVPPISQFNQLRAQAKELGINTKGMNQEQIIDAIDEKYQKASAGVKR